VRSASAAASGSDVPLSFTLRAAPALKNGALETIQLKGYPPMEQVVAGFRGRLLLCDLCFEALGIEADELRSRVEIARTRPARFASRAMPTIPWKLFLACRASGSPTWTFVQVKIYTDDHYAPRPFVIQ